MLHAAVIGTYAAPLRMHVRRYAWIYSMVCACAAAPHTNAMCYESPFAAVCFACAEAKGSLYWCTTR